MKTVRLKFNKVGLSIFFSQLDLQRVFARAFRKSKLPVWYSQGFNPHIYMSFTLPLPLGHYSYCESVDFRLVEDMPFSDILRALKDTLPSGIELLEISEVDYKGEDIRWAEYNITLYNETENTKNALNIFNAENEVLIEKKSKKKTQTVNLKDFVKSVEIVSEEENIINISCIFSSGIKNNLNPNLFLNYLETISDIKTFESKVVRIKLFDENMKILQKKTCN